MRSPSHSEVISLLLSLMDAIRGDVQAKLPKSSSFLHLRVLGFIAQEEEPSMRDVADYLRITSPGATMVVDKLVEHKVIDRCADAGDRRIVRLAMTAKGRKTLEAGMRIVKATISRRLATLSKPEQKQLSTLLKKII